MKEIDIFIPAKGSVFYLANLLTVSIKKTLEFFDIEFARCSNTPHISLYQLNAQKLEQIKETVKAIASSYTKMHFVMDKNIELVGKNIFWRSKQAEDHQGLKSLLTEVVEKVAAFKAEKPLKQIRQNFAALAIEQRELVDKYGVYWGLPNNFDPHITLVYNTGHSNELLSKKLQEIEIKEDVVFEADSICIGTIGYHGNIESVICSYELK